ncbi:rab GTPase-activating protein 22 isoform X2 [Capsicum annuum]|uniref:rab GTPase-activating protein 22 isoform X2 n=2 Tax=Capsicum annuum TaxID=4072 RepID=UPI001FB1617A|nr:rab GTPase-activating protein 22 isoform X2 [Capsicum annuum]
MGNSKSSVFFKKDDGVRAMKNCYSEELDSYYTIRPECLAEVPKTRFKSRVGKTLSERRWKAAFSKDGYLDIAAVLRRIQRGGIHPSIKGAAWEFLLGCFDPESTFEERNRLRQQRREQYAAWKSECQNIVPIIGSGKLITSAIVCNDGQPIASDDGQPIASDDGQPIASDDGQPIASDNGQPAVCATSTSNSQDNDAVPAHNGDLDKKMLQWKLILHQIGLDVVRTDRTLVFYENEANQAKLWDVLAVYAWMDKDIGYVQGMSDICSPMIILLENEADAYWCFERAMRRLRDNFKCSADSVGVQSQLGTLAQIVKTVDPKLHQHLEELDGGEYLFAFRMLMVLFRREFSFVDSLYLWEVMWAMEYNPNIYSSYDDKRQTLLSELLYDDKPGDKHKLKEYGKFERNNLKTGAAEQNSALSVFLVASVLETKHRRLMKEAKGLDDVVQILGEISGNLDARKALDEALKVHKKYLKQAKKS